MSGWSRSAEGACVRPCSITPWVKRELGGHTHALLSAEPTSPTLLRSESDMSARVIMACQLLWHRASGPSPPLRNQPRQSQTVLILQKLLLMWLRTSCQLSIECTLRPTHTLQVRHKDKSWRRFLFRCGCRR